MTSLDARERLALCDLLDRVGPDQPTLCGGWTTGDLAAHLWVRESDPLAGPGLVISTFAEATDERMTRAGQRWSYPELVRKVRGGPPRWSIFAVPVLGSRLNTIEYFVHHEDVRRAESGTGPRGLSAADQDELWKRFTLTARALLRKAPTGVVLRRLDGRSVTVKASGTPVTVVGEPSELVLFGFGRGPAAQVELIGDDAAVGALRQARLGI